jgi:hypothetical protein
MMLKPPRQWPPKQCLEAAEHIGRMALGMGLAAGALQGAADGPFPDTEHK